MESSLNKIVKIQHEIESLLNKKNGVTCHFINEGGKLKLITYNPTHGETFLLHSEKISSDSNYIPISSLGDGPYLRMLDYVKRLIDGTLQTLQHNESNKSYTVIWNKSDGVEHKSYFYAENMFVVLEKFYYGKDGVRDSFNILEIKQNPIA